VPNGAQPTDDVGAARLTSDALLLKRPTEEDRVPFIAAMRASVRYHYPWMVGWTTNAAYDAYLERGADERQDLNILCRVSDGAILGFFNIGEIVRGVFQSAYLGYGGVAGYGGKGYMTLGMQLLLKRAFDELALHRIEANIQPGNAPSLALAQRSGFVREGLSEAYLKINGQWRDHERWAIRAETWRAR
jgi:[ribosomal protein S5]-alanine N-acetyltransferase